MVKKDNRTKRDAKAHAAGGSTDRIEIFGIPSGSATSDPIRRGSAPGQVESIGSPGGEIFAADVVIRGWKIVGGTKWTGDAKVGAYVGERFHGLATSNFG